MRQLEQQMYLTKNEGKNKFSFDCTYNTLLIFYLHLFQQQETIFFFIGKVIKKLFNIFAIFIPATRNIYPLIGKNKKY